MVGIRVWAEGKQGYGTLRRRAGLLSSYAYSKTLVPSFIPACIAALQSFPIEWLLYNQMACHMEFSSMQNARSVFRVRVKRRPCEEIQSGEFTVGAA